MGFLFASGTGAKQDKQPSKEMLHRLQCRVCPLNKIKKNLHPHIEPTGTKRPLVYMLGEAPGEVEDREAGQFLGPSGKFLRARIPKSWLPSMRWNNVVRTRPPDNRDPEPIEIECCRPSVAGDIAATRPAAVLGFGAVALEWATGQTKITDWRGRRTPIDVGGHQCWFYPLVHPNAILHWLNAPATKSMGLQQQLAFEFDIRRALADVEDGLPQPAVHTLEMVSAGIETFDGKPGDLERLLKKLEWAARQDVTGVDLETNCVRPYKAGAKILTAAVGSPDGSFSFALRHKQAKWTRAQLAQVESAFVRFLKSRTHKAVHFLRFEQEWLAYFYGWELVEAPAWGSTESQAAVIDDRVSDPSKSGGGPMSLAFLVRQQFGVDIKELSPLDKEHLDDEPIGDVLWYNAVDAKYHCLLFIAQDDAIRDRGYGGEQYQEMLERVPTCVITQLKGIPTNYAVTTRLAKKYLGVVEEVKKHIAGLPEVEEFTRRFRKQFNPQSDDHCASMFRDLLGRREGYRGDDRYAVDEDVLTKIGGELATSLVRLRKANKRMSYVYRNDEEKGKVVRWPDGRLHPNFNTTSVRTKRLSCDNPNAQNMIKRDEEGKEIREQIEAPEDHVIVAVDWGQIQARGIAMASRDRAFCKALWERYDVHGDWALRIAHEYPARVGGRQYLTDKKAIKKFRGDVKNQWTFPLFFGAQLKRVSEALTIPENVLKPLLRKFQNEFSGVWDWHERLEKFYQEHGYVDDLFGFRHFAPLSYNQMINSPIQSLESLFVMRGMNRLRQRAVKTGDWAYAANAQIHDDLTFFPPERNVEHYVDVYVRTMLGVTFDFVNVPMTVEVSLGKDLLHMEEVLVASSDEKQWREAA